MQRILGMMLLVAGASVFAMGAIVPEISAGSAGSALALLAGTLLIVRGRRKK